MKTIHDFINFETPTKLCTTLNDDKSSEHELISHLKKKTNEICRGNYSGLEELYPYIEENKGEVGELAENFVLMATKLEAREYDLTRKIEELQVKNNELSELQAKRTEASLVFFGIISLITIFTFTIEILHSFEHGHGLMRVLISRGTDLTFIIAALIFIMFIKLPIREFGLTMKNWKKSLKESMIVTIFICGLLLGIKYWSVKEGWMDGSHGLMNFGIFDWTFVVYLLVAPLQEFLARGVCLTSIERNVTGRYAMPAIIILSAIAFGLPHMTFSITFALWGMVGGVIWSILYLRHRTILGVSISHYLVGSMAFLCGFVG